MYSTSYHSDSSIPSKSIFDLNIPRIFDNYPSSSRFAYDQIYTCQVTGWIVCLRLRFQVSNISDEIQQEAYYIYNPITGQYIVVPQCKSWQVWLDCALIFAQKTNQLKLLEFCEIDKGRREAYIQTIGTDAWRNIGEVPDAGYIAESPVLLNGHYHWFHSEQKVINCFNVEEEAFQASYETPLCFQNYGHSKLGLLQGCLCLSTYSNSTEIWVMNEYGNQDSWTKTFVFPDIPFVEFLTGLPNGDILMLWDFSHYREIKYATFICYDPRSRNSHYQYLLSQGTQRR